MHDPNQTDAPDTTLEKRILDTLEAKNIHLALAESCTGGLVASRITRVSGSSERFWGSFVCYQVDAKSKMLGVDLAQPDQAVSPDCTRELVRKTLEHSECELAAAITGYMGPNGGTAEDPVGTVYLALLGKKLEEKRIQLPAGERTQLQWAASTALLEMIDQYLQRT